MKKTQEEIEREVDEHLRKQWELDAEKLRQAKATAAANGKEPFDLDKLHQYWIDREYEEMDDELISYYKKDLEYRYYTSHPEMMTLEEFGAYLKEMDKWL